MPLYEYECTACHKHTEKIQKFSDTEITTCPHCGGKLQRVISAPAIAFKGGGWFKDGYGNAKPTSAGTAESGTAGEGSSTEKTAQPSSEGSGSTTPAAAPSSAPAVPASADKK